MLAFEDSVSLLYAFCGAFQGRGADPSVFPQKSIGATGLFSREGGCLNFAHCAAPRPVRLRPPTPRANIKAGPGLNAERSARTSPSRECQTFSAQSFRKRRRLLLNVKCTPIFRDTA